MVSILGRGLQSALFADLFFVDRQFYQKCADSSFTGLTMGRFIFSPDTILFAHMRGNQDDKQVGHQIKE